jgi:hypothetical protein
MQTTTLTDGMRYLIVGEQTSFLLSLIVRLVGCHTRASMQQDPFSSWKSGDEIHRVGERNDNEHQSRTSRQI